MTKKCPFCAESILAEAAKCRYCSSWMPDAHLTHAALLFLCPSCASISPKSAQICGSCGTQFASLSSAQLSPPISSDTNHTLLDSKTLRPSTKKEAEESIDVAQEENVDVFILSFDKEEKSLIEESPAENVKSTELSPEHPKSTELPPEHPKSTELPSDHIKPAELPSDHVKPAELPSDHVKPAELPSDHVKPAEPLSEKAKQAELVAISINEQLKKAFSPIPVGVNDTFAGVALAALAEEAKEAKEAKEVLSAQSVHVSKELQSSNPEEDEEADNPQEPGENALDADLLFEEIVQELQGDEFKMFEVLSTVRRKFWSPLRSTFQNVETRSLRKVLHSLNLSPIRASIREIIQDIGSSLFQTYEDHVDEVATSLGLSSDQKQYLMLESKEKELLLGELRGPFREFIERLETLDEVCDNLKDKLENLPPSQRAKLLTPLLSSSVKRRLEQYGEARGIEASWRMLHAEITKLAQNQDVLQEDMKELGEAMEQFLGQLEPTYGAILNRILEIWSERLVATLREMGSH